MDPLTAIVIIIIVSGLLVEHYLNRRSLLDMVDRLMAKDLAEYKALEEVVVEEDDEDGDEQIRSLDDDEVITAIRQEIENAS